MIPEVQLILEKIKDIHEKKNVDYSAKDRNYENFERAAELCSWFDLENHKPFVNHIATKLTRLATLLNSDAAPKNESIEDTYLDLCTYCILWYGYYQYSKSGYAIELQRNKEFNKLQENAKSD